MITALDIGTYSIKLIQSEINDDKINIINHREKIIDSSKVELDEMDASHTIAAIQELTADLNINPKKIKAISTGLPGRKASIKQITTIDMEESELATSLEFEAKKHIPLDGTDAILDFHIIGQNKKEVDKIDLILVATSRNIIQNHNELIKKAGYKPGPFGVDALAIYNSYLYHNDLPQEGVDVIINIGYASTTLICCGVNHRFFVRELEISGLHFIDEIMKSFSIPKEDAISKLAELGLESFTEGDNNEIDTSDPLAIKVEKKTVHSNLVEELRKTLRYYMKSSNQAFFNKFHLTGGGATIPGLEKYIKDELNVELEVFNPFSDLIDDSDYYNSKYTTALGLVLGHKE